MPEWAWFLVAYFAASVLLALTDEDMRKWLGTVFALPLMLPLYGLAFLSERGIAAAWWRVGNRQMFASLQRWWDGHPDADVRMIRVGRGAVLWSTKGNAWKDPR